MGEPIPLPLPFPFPDPEVFCINCCAPFILPPAAITDQSNCRFSWPSPDGDWASSIWLFLRWQLLEPANRSEPIRTKMEGRGTLVRNPVNNMWRVGHKGFPRLRDWLELGGIKFLCTAKFLIKKNRNVWLIYTTSYTSPSPPSPPLHCTALMSSFSTLTLMKAGWENHAQSVARFFSCSLCHFITSIEYYIL